MSALTCVSVQVTLGCSMRKVKCFILHHLMTNISEIIVYIYVTCILMCMLMYKIITFRCLADSLEITVQHPLKSILLMNLNFDFCLVKCQ